MKLVKKFVAVMLAGVMVFSMASCSKSDKGDSSKSSKASNKSAKVEFTVDDVLDAAEKYFDVDPVEGYVLEENTVAPMYGKEYKADKKYLAFSMPSASFLTVYEFVDEKEAEAFFEANLEQQKEIAEDYAEYSLDSGKSGYICSPKKSDFEFLGIYFCDNTLFILTTSVDTEREKAMEFLDDMNLPHVK